MRIRHFKYLPSLQREYWNTGEIQNEPPLARFLYKAMKIYCAIREPAMSTAICPTYAQGGERMWPWPREQGVLINTTGQCWNIGLLTDAKHISLFCSVLFSDPLATCLFLHYLFARVSALEWHPKHRLAKPDGVSPGNFLGQLNTLLFWV